MSTTSTATNPQIQFLARVGAAALLVSTALVVSSGPVRAEGSTDQQDAYAYVNSLLAWHDASLPYTQADDYVRTLIFWHHNPDWTPAG